MKKFDGLVGFTFVFRNGVKHFRLVWRYSEKLYFGHLWDMNSNIVERSQELGHPENLPLNSVPILEIRREFAR